jgi:hypothetical protein
VGYLPYTLKDQLQAMDRLYIPGYELVQLHQLLLYCIGSEFSGPMANKTRK